MRAKRGASVGVVVEPSMLDTVRCVPVSALSAFTRLADNAYREATHANMLLARSSQHRRNADSPGRRILWVPLFVCGLLFVLLTSGRRRKTGLQRSPSSNRTRPARPSSNRARAARQRLLRLRDAVVGNRRDAIEQLLGPPPAVAGASDSPTWYYPLDPVERRVMAIEFDGAVARDAQFVDAPRR